MIYFLTKQQSCKIKKYIMISSYTRNELSIKIKWKDKTANTKH